MDVVKDRMGPPKNHMGTMKNPMAPSQKRMEAGQNQVDSVNHRGIVKNVEYLTVNILGWRLDLSSRRRLTHRRS